MTVETPDAETAVLMLRVLLARAGGKIEISGRELDDAVAASMFDDVIAESPPASEAFAPGFKVTLRTVPRAKR